MCFICGGQSKAHRESVLSFNHMGPRVQQRSLPTEPSHWPRASQSAIRMLKDAGVTTQEHWATERNHWAQPGGWQYSENFWKNKAVCGVNREKWLQIASTNFGNDNNYINNLKRKQLFFRTGWGRGRLRTCIEAREGTRGRLKMKGGDHIKTKNKEHQMRVNRVFFRQKFSFLGRWDGANWWENTRDEVRDSLKKFPPPFSPSSTKLKMRSGWEKKKLTASVSHAPLQRPWKGCVS